MVGILFLEQDIQYIRMDKIELSYRLFLPNNRRIDQNNVYSIVDKFFQDALVHGKILKDDSFKYSGRTIFEEAVVDNAIDKKYVLVTVKDKNEITEI